ncbi:hypothetical protein UY3_07688 [Chelonia mydas]|uniref:Myb/SANT-like DNA-binding domain-containing protein n=1 Tax=Chelonia mydas TaxID=8469 RepID=M7BB10_CHEMY|nr:hypothetical protein UY3_07688 [Chelonia mydas]
MQSSSAEVTMQSQNRKRAPAWTEWEVLDLIAVWGDESVLSELCSKRRNAKIFEKISKSMKDRGYNRNPQQYRVKLKELSQAYQRTRDANGCSGSEPQTCRFYDELHAILGGAPTTTPALCVDSVNGLSRNRDADFGDKEDGEEEEVEAQQASGETIFPDSQEQFFTLDVVPSQPTEVAGMSFDKFEYYGSKAQESAENTSQQMVYKGGSNLKAKGRQTAQQERPPLNVRLLKPPYLNQVTMNDVTLLKSSASMDLSPHTAVKSRTSCSVHAGALHQFWDCMIYSDDELCMVTCADELAMLAKQEMRFKSSRAFSCIPGQCI